MGRIKVSKEEKSDAVKRYMKGSCNVSTLANKYGVAYSTVLTWIQNYQSIGTHVFECSKNTKYEDELKWRAVRDYLQGKQTMRKICEKYQIKSTGVLRSWILKYNNHEQLKSQSGGSGRIMVKGRKTTLEERIEIVKDFLESGSSYEEIAGKHQVSYQQVYQWVRKYQEHGIEGLQDRRGKRKEQDAMTEADKLRAELKMEKAKNKHLEMEVAFLKKLKEIERRRY